MKFKSDQLLAPHKLMICPYRSIFSVQFRTDQLNGFRNMNGIIEEYKGSSVPPQIRAG